MVKLLRLVGRLDFGGESSAGNVVIGDGGTVVKVAEIEVDDIIV